MTRTQVPVVGDFNGDGCDDIAAFTRGPYPFVHVALSTGWAFGDPTIWHTNFAGGVDVPGAGDFSGDGHDDAVSFTRGLAADVYVAPSNGLWFTSSSKWNDWFAFGLEIPMPAVLW